MSFASKKSQEKLSKAGDGPFDDPRHDNKVEVSNNNGPD